MQYECEQYLDTQEDAVADGSSYARTDYIECTGMSTDDLWEVVWIFTLSNPQYYLSVVHPLLEDIRAQNYMWHWQFIRIIRKDMYVQIYCPV